jgi:MFS family permease
LYRWLEVPFGVLADRWSRNRIMALACVALLVSSTIGGLSQNVATYRIFVSDGTAQAIPEGAEQVVAVVAKQVVVAVFCTHRLAVVLVVHPNPARPARGGEAGGPAQ